MKQLQIQSGLELEPEHTMARILRCLDLSIAEKVKLQAYWTSKDVRKLTIQVEKHSKKKRPFSSSYSDQTQN